MEKYQAKNLTLNALAFIKRNSTNQIQNRGLNYFIQGNILDVSYEPNFNKLKFLIKGSTVYQCFYTFDEFNEVKESHCDCPYDDYCKHQVAAAFWMTENQKGLIELLQGKQTTQEVKTSIAKSQPKPRNSFEPYVIPNYLKMSEPEMADTLISRDTQMVKILHYELYKTNENTFSGEAVFEDPYSWSFRDESKKFRIVLKHQHDGLAVSCGCNVRVKKLCSHGYAMVKALKKAGALDKIQDLPKEQLKTAFANAADTFGLENNQKIEEAFQLSIINGNVGLSPVGKYKKITNPLYIDHVLGESSLTLQPEKSLHYKSKLNQMDIYQLGFAFWFSNINDAITELSPIVGTSGKKELPMEIRLQSYRQDKYMNVDFKYGDHALMDLSQKLEESHFRNDEDNMANLSGLIHEYGDFLESHPFLYINNGRYSDDIKKGTLRKIKFIPHQPAFKIEVEQKGEFIYLKTYILQDEVKIGLSDKSVELHNELFISVKDNLYFLPDSSEVAQLRVLNHLEDRTMTASKFPELFEKYLKYIASNKEVDFDNLKSFEVKKKKINPVQKELYLSELDNFVIFRPFIRFNDDSLLEAKKENRKLDLSGKTITEKSFDEQYAEGFIELMQSVHPKFQQQKMASFYHLTYAEMMENNAFFRIFSNLTEANVKIFGLKNLKKLKVNPHKGKVEYNVKSGIDWFDIEGGIYFGDEFISLEDLQKKFIPGSAFVELSDGMKGMIPEEWLRKLEDLFRHSEIKNKKLKLSKKHFSLVDRLFNEIKDEKLLAELADKQQKLLNFNQLNEYPIPAKVKATLRHYQEDGFQWLCFLDEFQWGGILADDMGLGKTLQVITFLSHILEKKSQTNLVVVPTSLLFNWENELKKFAPHLKVHFYYGADRIKSTDPFDDFDIVFTSYGHMLADIKILKEFPFNYVILDESQAIKNAASKRFKAARLLQAKNRIAMTGTPIENNTFDLFAQMSFLNPGFLGSAKSFKESYANAIDKDRNQEKAKNLQQMIKPFVLRRTKAQVATELPDKTEDVLYCEMGKEQRKVYDAMRNEIRDSINKKIEDEGLNKAQFSILEGLTQLRLVCDSPEILAGEEKYGTDSAKLKILKEHIAENTPNHKILIFSQFVKMLKVIEKELQSEGMEYAYLDGQSNQKNRQENVRKFQEQEDCRIFLISLKAGGTGLNLMAADYVYLVDPWWNPAVENQAIDRCYRIGQDKKVIAYRMICKNTIEEKIMDLKSRKTAIAGDIISTDENTLKQLDKEDIMALFD
jgi:superfamily II DNA or RNA helicase